MAEQFPNPSDQVVLGEEVGRVRLITLNRPRQLNVISSDVVSLLAEYLEKWEKDDVAELILIKRIPALKWFIECTGFAITFIPTRRP